MKEESPKRTKLKLLSQKAKAIQDDDPEAEGMRINDILIEYFYKDEEHTEFNTYKQWLEKGFQVQEGQKSFVVWGKKRKSSRNAKTEDKEKEEYKFFPLAFLFSNKQIKEIKKDKNV